MLMQTEQTPKISRQELLFNRQVNYIIIEKIWERVNRNTKKDKEVFLYHKIGFHKNLYSQVRTGEFVDLATRWEWKDSKLRVLGLSKEIMTGLEMIEVDGITKKDWEEYFRYRYIDTEKTPDRTNFMQQINRTIDIVFKGLKVNRKDERDISKLFYYFVCGKSVYEDVPEKEMLELKNSLQNITIQNIKSSSVALRLEVFNALKDVYKKLDTIIKYDNLTD